MPSIDIIAGAVSDFPPNKHSDHDRLKRRHGEFKVLHFFTFRRSDVVLVGVQDPVILHLEDDKMQHIVIIGRFAELILTLAIQPSLWISIPKTDISAL